MRPQDIEILLKIVALGEKDWQLKDLASSLFISASEVSESLNRSQLARLIDHRKERVNRQNLMDFLQHGLRYVFPQHPGSLVNSIPTAHGHPFMQRYFDSDMIYVRPDALGDARGQALEPFYGKQTLAIK